MAKTPHPDGAKLVASNRKASHDYFLEDRFEAGIALMGTEIKSVRAGKVQLREAYVDVQNGQAMLLNAHIATYDPASRENHDPLRARRLLLHKKEIARLFEKIQQKGYTIVPTKMYLAKGRAKVEIALAKGKREYDKRQAIAERDSQREIARALGRVVKG
jgi:SsrA-binding protein